MAQTIFNPQTGERMVLMGGAWVPLPAPTPGLPSPQGQPVAADANGLPDPGYKQSTLGSGARAAYQAAVPATVESTAGLMHMAGTALVNAGQRDLGARLIGKSYAVQGTAENLAGAVDQPEGPTTVADAYKTGDWGRYLANTVGMAVGSTAPTLAAGAATVATGGGAAPALLATGMTSFGQQAGALFNDLRKAGVAPEKAATWSGLAGVPMAALDVYGLSKIPGVRAAVLGAQKLGLTTEGRNVFNRMFGNIVKGAGTEFLTEGSQGAIEEGAKTATIPGHQFDVANVGEQAVAGLIGGTVLGGPGAVAESFARPKTKEPSSTTKENLGVGQKPQESEPPVEPAPVEWKPLYDEADNVVGYVNPVTGERRTPAEQMAPIPTPLSGLPPQIETPPPGEVVATLTPDTVAREGMPAGPEPAQPTATADMAAAPVTLPEAMALTPDRVAREQMPAGPPPALTPDTVVREGMPASPPPVLSPDSVAREEMPAGPPVAPAPVAEIASGVSPTTEAPAEAAKVEAAAAEAEPEPTPAQAEAGNYRHGHVKVQGLDIAIETAKGGERRGVDAKGKPWSVTLPYHYGRFKKTEGADGDQVDVIIGDRPEEPTAYVVDQVDAETGAYDEHKVVVGAASPDEAKALYVGGFSDGKGEQRLGAITPMPVERLKQWLKTGDTTKPLSPTLQKTPQTIPAGTPIRVSTANGKTRFDGTMQAVEGNYAVVTDDKGKKRRMPLKTTKIAVKAPKKPRVKKPGKPMPLIRFLASSGGIADPKYAGEFQQMGLDKKWVPGFGPLIRKAPADTGTAKLLAGGGSKSRNSLDYAVERAIEAGYMDPGSTPADLLNLLDEETRGRPTFSRRDSTAVLDAAERDQYDREQDREREAIDEVKAAAEGLDLTPDEIEEIARSVYLDGADAMTAVEAFVSRDTLAIDQDAADDARPNEDAGGEDDPFDIPFEPVGQGEAGATAGEPGGEAEVAEPGAEGAVQAGSEAPARADRADGQGLAAEPGAEGLPQLVIPGTERSAKQAVAARDAKGGAQAKAPQKGADEGLFAPKDDGRQSDIEGRGAKYQRGEGKERRDTEPAAKTPDAATVFRTLRDLLNRIAGTKVTLDVNGNLTDTDGKPVQGQYLRGVISVALDAANAAGTARHEAIHFLKEVGAFPPAIWAALEKQAPTWRKQYRIDQRYEGLSEAELNEEAIAEAYAAWSKDPKKVDAALGARVGFNRIQKVLAAIRDALKRLFGRMPTADEVFAAVERGEFAGKGEGSEGGKAKEQRSEGDDVRTFAADLKEELGLQYLSLARSGDDLRLQMLEVPKGARKQGIGTKAMQRIVEYADKAGLRVTLTTGLRDSLHGTTSSARLKQFYKRFGFVENKGRNKDYRISDNMWRAPAGNAQRPKYDRGDAGYLVEPNIAETMQELDAQNYGLLQRVLPEKYREDVGAAIDRARHLFADRFILVRRLQEAVERYKGRPLTEAEKPYLVEEGYDSRVGEQKFRIDKDFREPILELMKSAKLSQQQVDRYLTARHAEERNDYIASINPKLPDSGSGMSTATARKILREESTPELEQIGALVDRMMEQRVDFLVESGEWSPAMADAVRSRYKHYVPLRGVVEGDNEPEVIRPLTGRGFAGTRGGDKRATGRFSEAPDVLATAFTLGDEAIIRGQKNLVRQAFYKLVQLAPDPAIAEIEPVETKAVVRKVPYKVTENGKTVTRYREEVDYRQQKATAPRDGMIVRIAGQPVIVRINHKGLLGEIERLGGQEVNALLRGMAAVTQKLSMLNTMWNPEFVLTNAARDVETALVNIGAQKVAGVRSHILKNWGRALKGAWHYQRTGKADTEWSRRAQEFRAAGGAVAFNQITDVKQMQRSIDEQIATFQTGKVAAVKGALRKLGGFIEDANGSVDNAIRLSVYGALRDAGYSQAKAASVAKNLTVNFNRRGELGSAMNALFMFFNAGVQGTAVMLSAMKRPAVQRFVAATVALGVAQELLAGLFSQPPEDDEDGLGLSSYDRIPEWEKQRNMIIPTGPNPGDYVKIPLFYGYGWFHNIGRIMAAYARGARQPDGKPLGLADAMANVGTSFGQNIVPPGLSNWLVPTVAAPFVELAKNENYFGAPIKPTRMPNDHSPESQRFYPSVSPISREIAQFLNAMTGGDEFRPGLVDISPEAISHVADVYAGAAGAQVVGAISSLMRVTEEATGTAAEDPKLGVRDLPFARKLAGYESPGMARDATYRRMDALGVLNDMQKAYKDKETRNPQALAALRREHGAELALIPEANKLRRELSSLRKQRLAALNSDAPAAEKRRRTDAIAEREKRAMAEFNRRYMRAVGRNENREAA